jgi:hypothetical protein
LLKELFIGCAFVGGTVLVTLASYFLMRWITGGDPEAHTKDLASSVIFRVAALHGLILALVFAQEMFDYQQIKSDGTMEANAVADVYFDAGRYGSESRTDIQKGLAKYLRIVIEDEWSSLASTGRLSQAAWDQWDAVYNKVLDLNPSSKRQESLRDNMLSRLHTIGEKRDRRENEGDDQLSSLFWLAAVSGVIFIALAYFPYPPQRHNLILICLFGLFTGVVVYFIYAFENPYSPPGAIAPTPFIRLYQQLPPG